MAVLQPQEAVGTPLAPPQPAPPLTAAQLALGPRLTPEKILYVYDPAEWEAFIRECAHYADHGYQEVVQFGAANDRGIDIAGFYSPDGFKGTWDCFQCKHYDKAIAPGVFWPELVKLILGHKAGHFTMPTAYYIAAPRGCGPTLAQYFQNATEMKDAFLNELEDGSNLIDGLTTEDIQFLRDMADALDYSTFHGLGVDYLVEVHAQAPTHLARFGGALPDRPPIGDPPAIPDDSELNYVNKLLHVYSERYPDVAFDVDAAHSDLRTAEHFPRQREAFYSAEALARFAEDAVPPGTFEALKDEIWHGVIEQSEAQHANGFERLTAVLQSSTQVAITVNALISVTDGRDRKGICHHLANEDRLTWVQP